jgi:hypothetical protein
MIRILLLLALLSPLNPAHAAPEAVEVTMETLDLLPKGREADGIAGDFVLRNDLVEAVISHNAPNRRANMSTFYGEDGITPGALYDLAPLNSGKDNLTIFTPSLQKGRVSWVRILSSGADGVASIETMVTAALGQGVSRRHVYSLRDGWPGLLIVTTFRNESSQAKKVSTRDSWRQFERSGTMNDISWADGIDPRDKIGYAFGYVTEENAMTNPPEEPTLAPGESLTVARFIAVASSPAEAIGLVRQRRNEAGGFLSLSLQDPENKPVSSAEIQFPGEKISVPAYPDATGKCTLFLPAGPVSWEVQDMGRAMFPGKSEVKAGETTSITNTLGAESAVTFHVHDGKGDALPCRVQFHGRNGTPNPLLGNHHRAHGSGDQYFSEKGDFRVALPAGDYQIVITHGPEYSHFETELKLEPGKTARIEAVLTREIDSTGWVSTDFHNHTTQSGDNICGVEDRIINLATEHIEFAPTTEHNRIYDWAPLIDKLGLASRIKTIPGMELTGSNAHLNTFPLTPKPGLQDGGGPAYHPDPRMNAITLRAMDGGNVNRWIQVNHPDIAYCFNDANRDGKPDGGFPGFLELLDGIETANTLKGGANILTPHPYRGSPVSGGPGQRLEPRWDFAWLQLLNKGHRIAAVGVADAHRVYGQGVGSWRTYVRSSTDDPAKIDPNEMSVNAKRGHSFITSGPFLDVSTVEGFGPGDDVRLTGRVDLRIKVQCASWYDIDRVQVLVNGRPDPKGNFSRTSHPELFKAGPLRFSHEVRIDLQQDSHIIVVACGLNSTMEKGYGTDSYARLRPCAYNNPLFVDIDGDGFRANGDTLDWPLPVADENADVLNAKIKARGLEVTEDAAPAKPKP